MGALAYILRLEAYGFLVALGAIVSYRLLTGEIRTVGLLHDKTIGAPRSISPARVQMLLATPLLILAALGDMTGSADGWSLAAIAAGIGSHGSYLLAKFTRP